MFLNPLYIVLLLLLPIVSKMFTNLFTHYCFLKAIAFLFQSILEVFSRMIWEW